MKLPSLDSFIIKASATFKRFPIAIIAAITGSVYCVLLVHLPFSDTSSHYYYWNIVRSCYLGMLLFIAISIYAQNKRISKKITILLSLAGAAIILVYYFSLPPQFMTVSFTRFILFTIALHLLIAFIPYLNKDYLNGFWQYNKIVFLRILTSALYTIVLYLGLSLALLAIDKLFNVKIEGKAYFDLWILLAGIFNTWFFLSGLPVNFRVLELDKDYPKGLKIFTQYVLLPLITVYLLILYAYMFKIIISGQWPVGWVSYLVIGFSIGGILSLLLIYPVRNDEQNKWILVFSRFFYFALFPLIILLFLAVKRRISDYGITEQRYFILVLALWLLLIAIYFLFSKPKNIKLIPVSLCILALVVSFGPWSAFRVSLSSQNKHLQSLLQKHAMLAAGKIVKAKDTIPFKDHKQISSIINYLVRVHGYKTLQHYFGQSLDSGFKNDQNANNRYDYTQVNKIHSLMNIKYIGDYQLQGDESIGRRYMNFDIEKKEGGIDIQGYDYFISDLNINEYDKADSSCNSYLLGKNNLSFCFDYKKKHLLISDGRQKDSVLSFDISSFANFLEKENNNNNLTLLPTAMTLTAGNSSLSTKLIFNNIHFEKQDNAIDQLRFTADIFIKYY